MVELTRPIHHSTFDPSPPSLSHSLPVPTLLVHGSTQVHRFSQPKLTSDNKFEQNLKILKFSAFHGKPFQSPKKLRDGSVNGSRTRPVFCPIFGRNFWPPGEWSNGNEIGWSRERENFGKSPKTRFNNTNCAETIWNLRRYGCGGIVQRQIGLKHDYDRHVLWRTQKFFHTGVGVSCKIPYLFGDCAVFLVLTRKNILSCGSVNEWSSLGIVSSNVVLRSLFHRPTWPTTDSKFVSVIVPKGLLQILTYRTWGIYTSCINWWWVTVI